MLALTEETRQDYIKQARNEAENSRISIRNIRRDANNSAKDLQKENEISEDELKRIEAEVQKTTDHFIGLVEEELKNKEADLAAARSASLFFNSSSTNPIKWSVVF